MASDRQCCRWRCVGGADGNLLVVVLYGALGLELADMKTNFEMAKEAGLRDSVNLERFAALVRADEREACAKVCDDKYAEYPEVDPDYAFALAASDLAKAIRARGQA
jgi:hypothetical protein